MVFSIRQAVPADVPALQALIAASVRGLQGQDYTPSQCECALETVYGVDSQLIADGTYFAVEIQNTSSTPEVSDTLLVGCGGWSGRKTLYGGDVWREREDTRLDPSRDAAKIRAFFVHPQWARRGIGSRILEICESAAIAAGFTRFEMGATLTGVPLYQARGYVALERISIPLANGDVLPIVHMEKRLSIPDLPMLS
ncbi:MAG: Acetyltransferase, family [Chthonomonadales bacterium]|nr:Acetyltransferase, family [Chthonomonadales bacterium]